MPSLRTCSEERGKGVVEEIGVLEVAKQPEIKQKAEDEPALLPRPALAPCYLSSDDEVGRGEEDQQDEVDSAGEVLEVEGEEHHPDGPREVVSPEQVEYRDKEEKEDQEEPAIEE